MGGQGIPKSRVHKVMREFKAGSLKSPKQPKAKKKG